MNTIKLETWNNVPHDYTGIIEWENGNKSWYKNGDFHREDGPAYIRKDGVTFWDLDGIPIWDSYQTLDLANEIILSKDKHPKYPSIQIWKILDKDEIYEQIVIPGMEEFVKE